MALEVEEAPRPVRLAGLPRTAARWIIDSTRASGITGHKTLSTGRAELGIAFMPSDDGQKLVVNLTASAS
jgi:hypothetical protein